MFKGHKQSVKSKIESVVHISEDDAETHTLHRTLTVSQIVAMKEKFERQPGRKMTTSMFRKTLQDIAKIILEDAAFEKMCARLNFTRNVADVYWEEFLIYLRVGLDSEIEHSYSGNLDLPITGHPKETKSHHRLPIGRILFVPEIQQNRNVNFLYGVYVTCSREGIINYWSIDMEKERTVQSKSPKLISQQTWITDIVSLPDVSVICTSSTERDLRFYDTSAKKFELRVIITSLEEMVCSMYYKFYIDISKLSKLVIGNSAGKVKLIYINPKDRGPFKSLPKMPLFHAHYDQFCKGAIKDMSVIDIPTAHTDWVHQVSYFENIHCVVSVSTCSKESMLIYSPKSKKDCSYSFRVPKGFSCFSIAPESYMIATGGPDCRIRVWNPFVPSRAISVLRGHHGSIVSITFQDDKILISLDVTKCVKIWDVSEQNCIQNYFGLPNTLGERVALSTFYNPVSRQLFVCGKIIAFFQIFPLLNGEYTDGVSHSKEVSVVLYNTLFKSVITCGFDSFIIIWNPWKGKRKLFIRNAHTIRLQGELIPVQITAAAFDPTQQYLITGASDGTLKIWNFIIQTCVRNMKIERKCEIYAIVWIKNRILVMGENRVVTEFADSDDIGSSNYKSWMSRHQEDILCAATYLPQTLVTASHSGEIVFWRLETGQPYGMYNVSNPKERITMHYIPKTLKEKESKQPLSQKYNANRKISAYKYAHQSGQTEVTLRKTTRSNDEFAKLCSEKNFAINALICLTSRPVHPLVGTILAALDNGTIQIWSHHPGGGYLTDFKCVHNFKDYVVSMCTDENNVYLFTGHMFGYIKTWHLINFGVSDEFKVHVCMPKIRLIFPFLWKDVILGRAKRAHRTNVPLLLNSYKAHLKPVTGLVFISNLEILVSCSSDCSARVWTLNGQYMGTLGTFKPWTFISPAVNPLTMPRTYSLPADIVRSASFTTFKVLKGGNVEKMLTKKQQQQQYEQLCVDNRRVFGHRYDIDTILGKHFSIPPSCHQHYDVILDNNLPDVPIYSEIILQEPKTIERPPTPELMKNIRMQQKILAKQKTQ